MVSFLSVIVSAIVGMVIGSLWYSVLFGKLWMQLSGITPKQMTEAKKKSMGKSYALCFVGLLLMSYVLGMFIQIVKASTLPGGAMIGFWLWLGFIATTQLNSVLWENKSWKLYWLSALHYLVMLLVMGAILAAW